MQMVEDRKMIHVQGDGCFYPIAVFLGSDNKPARVRAMLPKQSIQDAWLTENGAMYAGRLIGKLKAPILDKTSDSWVFNHYKRLPILDMWGNTIKDGLVVGIRSFATGNPNFEHNECNHVIARDPYGRGVLKFESELASYAERHKVRNLFCNVDFDEFRLSSSKVVMPFDSLSEDLGLLAYQSSMLDIDFSFHGAIQPTTEALTKAMGNTIVLPNNWIDIEGQWLEVRLAFDWKSITFPKEMMRINVLMDGGHSLEAMILPEVLHMPKKAGTHYLTIMHCQALRELVLPACRAPLVVKLTDCPNLKVIRTSRRSGYVAKGVTLEAIKCPSIEKVDTPDYEYETFTVDNTRHPTVYKHDDSELCDGYLGVTKVLCLKERCF